MRKFILFLLTLFAFSLSAQQTKQVYITLDVSGSMYGPKYELANYTTQMIVSMCEPLDDVYIIVTGKKTNLSRQNNVLEKKLHYSLPELPLLDENAKYNYIYRDREIRDIQTFNKDYRPSSEKENWLFIIGDGEWEDYDNREFADIVESGTLHVCYLQTGNSLSDYGDFTRFVRSLSGVVDIRKSDTNPSTIRSECDYFAKKILGFSEVNLKLEKSGDKEVKFTPELPISGLLIVYQDEVSASDLPNLSRVSANGQILKPQLKGTPSTDRLIPPVGTREYNYWPSHVTLSGTVWRVEAKSPIPAGKSVEIFFDKNVNTNNVRIYPIIKDVDFGDFVLVPMDQSDSLKKNNDNTYSICRENSKAIVYIELSDDLKQKLSEDLLKKTKVRVWANNNPYTAKFRDGKFECEINLSSNETQFYAEIDCPGYSRRHTSIQKIIKNGDCPPPPPPPGGDDTVLVLPPIPLGTIIFEKTMKLCWTINDMADKEILDPNQFDLSVDIENSWLYEKPEIEIQGDNVCVIIMPKGKWCECIFPSRLNFKLIATPKNNAVFKKQYKRVIQPVYADIDMTSRWFDRCLWVLFTIGGLLLFIIYLRLLLKKNRFKKDAMINPSTWALHKGVFMQGGGYRLREKGFSAWFSRWFLPFDEKRNLSMSTHIATYNFTFIATEARNKIKFPVEQFDPATMTVTGYNPNHAKPNATHIDLPNSGIIDITAIGGNPDARLQFVAGQKNDEGGYRFFLGLFIVASLTVIAILTYLMIKAL